MGRRESFEVDAPTFEECPIEDVEQVQEAHPKFFATMAYPYMNGVCTPVMPLHCLKLNLQLGSKE